MTFRQIMINYPFWSRPKDNDPHKWGELIKLWQLNLAGLDDAVLAAALNHHIRFSIRWKGGAYPPTPGDIWVALDQMQEHDVQQAALDRSQGQGTRQYNPKAGKASAETVQRCMAELEHLFPRLREKRAQQK